jgi:hypothetical protein
VLDEHVSAVSEDVRQDLDHLLSTRRRLPNESRVFFFNDPLDGRVTLFVVVHAEPLENLIFSGLIEPSQVRPPHV